MLNRENVANHSGYDLRTTGNWRVIQEYDVQDLKVVGLAVPKKDDKTPTTITIDNSGQTEKQSGGPTWLIFILVIIFFVVLSLFQFY